MQRTFPSEERMACLSCFHRFWLIPGWDTGEGLWGLIRMSGWIVNWINWLSIRVICADQLSLEHVTEAFLFHLVSAAKIRNIDLFAFLRGQKPQRTCLKLGQVWFSSMGLNVAGAQVQKVLCWWEEIAPNESCLRIAHCIRKPHLSDDFQPGRVKAIMFFIRGTWRQLTTSFLTVAHAMQRNTLGGQCYSPPSLCMSSKVPMFGCHCMTGRMSMPPLRPWEQGPICSLELPALDG